jgi:hypothetical protein
VTPPGWDLSTIEARSEIRELTARYSLYVDTFQLEPLVALFVEDGVFDEIPCGLGKHEGRTALKTYYGQLFAIMEGVLHQTGNHILDQFDGTHARGSCTAIIIGVIGGSRMQLTCRYDDVYVRTEHGWRFRSRVVCPYSPVDHDTIASLSPGSAAGRLM